MSLLSSLFSCWWEELERPHRLTDQHFGRSLSIDDLIHDVPRDISPLDKLILGIRAPRRRILYHPYEKPIRKNSGNSVVHAAKDKFLVNLDVQQFDSDEITVKVIDGHVVVEGKHEDKQDEHGFVSRQFVRMYLVPEQCDINAVESHLSSDGVLTITAPNKKALENKNERVIAITCTGVPASRSQSESQPSGSSEGEAAKTSPVTVGQEKSVKTVKAA